MDVKGKKIMVLGGWGLVGFAICRNILEEEPGELIVHSLDEWEANEACEKLKKNNLANTKITPNWGNMFVREAMQGLSRVEILENSQYRAWLIEDGLDDLTEEILQRSYLFQVVSSVRPDILY